MLEIEHTHIQGQRRPASWSQVGRPIAYCWCSPPEATQRMGINMGVGIQYFLILRQQAFVDSENGPRSWDDIISITMSFPSNINECCVILALERERIAPTFLQDMDELFVTIHDLACLICNISHFHRPCPSNRWVVFVADLANEFLLKNSVNGGFRCDLRHGAKMDVAQLQWWSKCYSAVTGDHSPQLRSSPGHGQDS